MSAVFCTAAVRPPWVEPDATEMTPNTTKAVETAASTSRWFTCYVKDQSSGSDAARPW